MKNKFIIAFAALLLAGFATFAQGKEKPVKIGYADLTYILYQMPEVKRVADSVDLAQEQMMKQVEPNFKQFQQKVKIYQDQAEGMTQAERQKEEQMLAQMQQQLQGLEQQIQQQMQIMGQRLTQVQQPAAKKAMETINKVAAENNYTHILRADLGDALGSSLLYVYDESLDITDLVLKNMGITPTEN